MRTVNRATTAAVLIFIGSIVTVDRAWAQIDLTGEWAVRLHEDQLHRNDVLPGGLAVGDYTGLPINDAARRKADSWDASILSARERQTIPAHRSTAAPRACGFQKSSTTTRSRSSPSGCIDPRWNNGTFRMIWIDRPSASSRYAAHTWQGFSTGTWQGSMLTVETTHVKMGWI